MTGLRLFDHLGRPITLGPLLGKGGEGAVFDVVNSPGLAAKLYDPPKSSDHETKLRIMIGLARKELCDVAAWPTAILYERLGGRLRGLVMRKVTGFKDIHFLYSPAHRKVTYPHADWRFLVHTAMNCAAAFDTLHAAGVVVADVNFGNVLVSADALVALVDCDSYQVQRNGHSFLCDVGIDLFTPPELQGRSYRGIVRTPNHDNFGLAVLVFYLLFMNRHPFSGRYLGPGDMPVEQAIAQFRFAFGRAAATYQMQTPPHAPSLSLVSSDLANLFELAFGSGSARPNARPTSRQWATALKTFVGTLRPCPSDPGHVYAPHLTKCPWCVLIAQGAPNFFVSVAYSRGLGSRGVISFVLSAVWARIEQVRRPNTSYARPPVPRPIPAPWPSGIGRALVPMPLPPSILRSPPAPPPALLNLGQNLPPKPSRPVILVSPPAPPAIDVGWPSRDKEHVKRSSSQVTVGVSVIAAAAVVPMLLFSAVAFALAGRGSTSIALALFSLAPLVIFIGFGAWWLFLESKRKEAERQLNREYYAELLRLQAEADRQLAIWRERLVARQTAARQKYEQRVASWESETAAIRSEAKQRFEAWERQLAFQQAEARKRYEQELALWRNASDNVKAEVRRRRDAATDAQTKAEAAETSWKTTAARFVSEFDRKKQSLSALRDRHDELGRKYVVERQQLQAKVREMQLEQFLDQEFISDNDIPGIGPGRTASLSSYNIETALDVDEATILRVPGFGPGLTARLLEWRRTVESKFVFNTAAGIPAQQQQALDSKYAQARQPIEMALFSGERELKTMVSTAESTLDQLFSEIKALFAKLAQADADLAVVPPGL